MKEASRFGILNTNADGSIYQFEEKPKQPKSNLASMGIYIFTASKLFKYLEEDDEIPIPARTSGKTSFPRCSMRAKRCIPIASADTGKTSVPFPRFGRPIWTFWAKIPHST